MTEFSHVVGGRIVAYNHSRTATNDRVIYAAVADPDRHTVDAFVMLYYRDRDHEGAAIMVYKPLHENAGPCATHGVSARVLDALTPTTNPDARRWRADAIADRKWVAEFHRAHREDAADLAGAVVEFAEPVAYPGTGLVDCARLVSPPASCRSPSATPLATPASSSIPP
ncbi:hypothetical protein IU469_31985 [Nocardia puris]|uniref:hypothetical protein n=1 Tax=Nocardia puris TaxID=208602 RepID=UPI0011BE73CB|nr:hypothetical protein [Nocardia puris]MBF6215941.1 hypothetical protein [Nocardia puris]MBF6370293.1 hypothetical protein [Nocardia puris]